MDILCDNMSRLRFDLMIREISSLQHWGCGRTAFTPVTLQSEHPDRDATGTNTMPETGSIDRPSVAEPAPGRAALSFS